MTYIIIKCVEDKISADVTLYDVTDILPDCFSAREYEHFNLSDGTNSSLQSAYALPAASSAWAPI